MTYRESAHSITPQLVQLVGRIVESVLGAEDEAALVRAVADLPLAAVGIGGLRLRLGPDSEEDALAGEEAAVRDVIAGGTVAGTLVCTGAPADPAASTPMLDLVASLAGRQLEIFRRLLEIQSLNQGLQLDRVYFEELFAASPEAIVLLDREDRVMRANRTFEELFGYTDAEAQGRTINELIVPEEEKLVASQLTHDVAEGRRVLAEAVRRRKDGSLLHVSIMGAPIFVKGSQLAVYGIYRDITAQKEAEEALRRLSTTDELTGLYNRRGFFLLAEQQRRLAIRRKAELLLLYIDVDDFKAINDTYGHLAGDRVLSELGHIMQSCFRDSDIVARVREDEGLLARMGGDEFVILAIDAGENGDDILRRRLHERVEEYNESGRPPCSISISIGSARMLPDHRMTIDALIAAADELMYESKRGRGRG